MNITEEQVVEWMKARLAEIRAGGVEITSLELKAMNYDGKLSHYWWGFGDSQSSDIGNSSQEVADQLALRIGSTADRVSRKRAEADKLLQEAKALEGAVV